MKNNDASVSDYSQSLIAPPSMSIEDYEISLYKKYSCQINLLSFCLGLFTNVGTMIITSSAKTNAEKFGHKELMALFAGILTFCGLITQFLNSAYFMKVKHIIKISIISTSWILSFLIYFAAYYVPKNVGFILSLIAAMLLGSFTSVAVITLTGFMKAFPS